MASAIRTLHLRPSRHMFTAIKWMITGFLLSYLGTMLAEGALPGLIAAGLLPVAALTAFRTVGMLLDTTTPLMMRFLERFSPGKLLVGSEAADAIASLAALILVLAIPDQAAFILFGYLLVAAILPLIVDIAEELYIAQAVDRDENAAVTFNVVISSSSAVIGFVLAQPLGALLAEISVIVLLAANIALSLGATGSRLRASRFVKTVPTVTVRDPQSHSVSPPSEKPAQSSQVPWRRRTISWFTRMYGLRLLSPFISGALSLIGAIYGTYLVIWIAGVSGSWISSAAVGLVAYGIGRVAGPVAAGGMSRKLGAATTALFQTIAYTVVIAGSLLIALFDVLNSDEVVLAGAMIVALTFLAVTSSGARAMFIALRQSRLSGVTLSRVIGVSRSLSATGTLLGVWGGLAVGVTTQPWLGLSISLATSIALTMFTVWSYVSGPATSSPQER